jgi:molecular chaperone DnaK (HSP70)
MVLTKMKETAEAYLGEKVTHAVVTVPACAFHKLFTCLLSLTWYV